MLLEHQILSKVLDEQNFFILQRYNITEEDFVALPEVYRFIKVYVQKYKTVPDFRTVVGRFENFEYIADVYDSFQYLCSQLKGITAKRLAYELLKKDVSKEFSRMDGSEFIDWLGSEVEKISVLTDIASAEGTNFATNGEERLSWYTDAKDPSKNPFIPTPYPTLTKHLAGGFEMGDYTLLLAYTNRGKSWIASDIGLKAWKSGHGVLHYSPELSKQQQLFRLDTLNGHFNNIALRKGELFNEQEYTSYLESFREGDDGTTPYIVKTMDDLQSGLSVEVIEADLAMNPSIKMVIIDGFNLMDHRGKDNNRNNMTTTSRKLRQIFGRYKVAGIVVHHTPTSSERDRMDDEFGNRLIEPPKLQDYSETVAVIQDASTVLTFDAYEGIGALFIAKARTPNVGEQIDLTCNFNLGFIEEPMPMLNF